MPRKPIRVKVSGRLRKRIDAHLIAQILLDHVGRDGGGRQDYGKERDDDDT